MSQSLPGYYCRDSTAVTVVFDVGTNAPRDIRPIRPIRPVRPIDKPHPFELFLKHPPRR